MSYTSSYHVGYYAPGNGGLRHCHTATGSGTPEWHEASNTHPATPDAHFITDAFNPEKARWAVVNSDYPIALKAQLIKTAQDMHDATLNQQTQIKGFNVSCPDCGVIFPSTLTYNSEGRWTFSFHCANSKCSNYNYEYDGTLKER